MLTHQRFLDRFDETDLGQKEPDGAACFKNGFFLHELKVAKDRNNAPFFWSEKDDCYVMWTWHGNFHDRHVSKVGTRNYGFHLVVGPDLVSEWKAKHGKK